MAAGLGYVTPTATRTVLLVEDDVFVRTIALDVLTHTGIQVIEAGDATEALRILEADPGAIAVLLTDVGLPGGVTGWALARHARALNPGLEVIYVTGFDHDASDAVPGSRILAKPYDPAALVDLCKR